ncbi:MAG TPA: hypothetical protein VFH27_06570 [Longimicrobiaceae bacterium]|nr:hypothetical protein [Longimicrobiaceae bacterium]
MYRRCIFCSADLGANASIAGFPVGRSLAFDGARGRLWAICPACARWNLAPLEERWEAVESAGRCFRDTRLRVQSENVGLCRLPDGTRLVRVGEALAGELAAWRYGRTLVGRRRQYLAGTAAVAAGAAAVVGGLWAVGGLAAASLAFQVGGLIHDQRQGARVMGHLPADESPIGTPIAITRRRLAGARMGLDEAGDPALVLAPIRRPRQQPGDALALVVRGDTGRTLLGRGMVVANARGASDHQVRAALSRLEDAGSAAGLLLKLAYGGMGIGIGKGPRARTPPEAVPMPAADRLALEMALHEQQERMALEGELAGLQAAWREAEQIARIADALPGDPAPEQVK